MAVQGYSIAFTRYQAIDFSVPFNEETKTILIPAKRKSPFCLHSIISVSGMKIQ